MAVGALLTAACFLYFFNILDTSNKALLLNIQNQKTEQLTLEAEQESYKKASQDLDRLKGEPYQPEDLFSKDTTLVSEIKEMEQLSQRLGVTYTLNGLSGTVQAAPKAKTQSELVMVPYSIAVNGEYASVLAFIQALENMDFITNVSTIAINGSKGDAVNASLTANFYLKK